MTHQYLNFNGGLVEPALMLGIDAQLHPIWNPGCNCVSMLYCKLIYQSFWHNSVKKTVIKEQINHDENGNGDQKNWQTY